MEDILYKIESLKKIMSYYKCAMMEIETKFNVLNEEFSLQYDRNPINSIKCRLKSIESIKNKLESKGLEMSFENITKLNDIAGIRVVCSFEKDVYTLSEALLKQDDIKLIEIKDYIKYPKPNGYRSLHLIVGVPIFFVSEKRIMPAEIQLRTISMDSWASLEHQLRYKKELQHENEDLFSEDLKMCASLSAELDSKMDRLREMMSL